MRRSVSLIALMVSFVAVTGAVQAVKFPIGVFKGSDGTNTIALDFDSTGVINAYVNDQPFSSGSYESRADTVKFGPVQGPEGYSCANGATYTWKLTDKVLAFVRVSDDCEVRMTTLTNLIWTRQ